MPLWMRFLFILIGIALLLWLPVEERGVGGALAFAAGISFLGGLSLLWKFEHATSERRSFRQWVLYYGALGAGGGVMVSLIAMLLLAFKTGIHAHGLPDYTPEQVAAIIRQTPAWTFAGLALGLAGAVLRWRGDASRGG